MPPTRVVDGAFVLGKGVGSVTPRWKTTMVRQSATGKKPVLLDGLVQVLIMGAEPFDDQEHPWPPPSQPAGPGLHTPVLLREALDFLAVKPDGTYLDATVGTGGHARAILARLGPHGFLVGMDRDAEALEVARRRLEEVGSAARFVLRAADFADVDRVCGDLGLDAVDGVVADLGLCSWQLDSAERGFSHALEGPLDMRFDRTQATMAADLLARSSPDELTRILFRYGEEPHARRIAQAIVRRRRHRALRTTLELAEVVRSAVPPQAHGHALARTFQALRIAVNGEVESLERFLRVVPHLLAAGGRLVIISFHSLEDRPVKQALGIGQRAGILRVLTSKPQRPTPQELSQNPRSRSARLRAAQKLFRTGPASPRGGDQ